MAQYDTAKVYSPSSTHPAPWEQHKYGTAGVGSPWPGTVSSKQQCGLPVAEATASVVAVSGAPALPMLPPYVCLASFVVERVAAGQQLPMLGLLPRATLVAAEAPSTMSG